MSTSHYDLTDTGAAFAAHVTALVQAQAHARAAGAWESIDVAVAAIVEDALSVEVRGDWFTPGDAVLEPVEYRVLIATGGPAARIVGELNTHLEPYSARLEVQDWGTPWEEVTSISRETLMSYVQCFNFGTPGDFL